MSAAEDRAAADAGRLKAGSLGPIGVAFFVLAAAAPMAAFVGAGPVIFSLIGPGVPLVYLLVAAVVAIFAVGYLRMSRHVNSAAGFVAYIERGLGARSAGATAGIVILTYIALQVGFWAQFGVFANQLAATYLGVDIPVWAWALVFIAATTVLAMRGVDMSLRVLGVILSLEVLIVLVLVGGILVGGVESPSFESFSPTVFAQPGMGVAILFVATCFTTFEATTVFAEEARNPRRTIPLALYFVIGFIALFYGIATWAVSMAVGPDAVQQAAADDLSGIMFALAAEHVGPWLDLAMQVMVVTSFIAMLLGMSNMFARYAFALARARILPTALSAVTRRQAPARAALANGVIVAALIAVFFALGADPMVHVYAWSVALGTVGFILIMAVASISVLVFFARRMRTHRDGLLATIVAPAIALVLVVVMLIFSIANYDALLLGGGETAKWLLLGLPIAAALGAIAARRSRRIDFDTHPIHVQDSSESITKQ
ncbi:APC family permease [Gulosibacter sp. 10]|uniref:APC family permease n=1 Tax=Gulosibacter sp. 10 TaxID=1255570 RepID=UPI00097E8FB4|nr:APC family permease [Gulosibacter sp. 10]SJM67257.1 amino acid permease family protein [Gulosibacter sp. 10]